MLKILTPKLLMTASCLAWSALTIGTAFVKNFSQLIGVRVLLGAAEAAIIPCILLYITMTVSQIPATDIESASLTSTSTTATSTLSVKHTSSPSPRCLELLVGYWHTV